MIYLKILKFELPENLQLIFSIFNMQSNFHQFTSFCDYDCTTQGSISYAKHFSQHIVI